MAIEQQVNFKSRRSGNGSDSGRGSFARSDMICHKCGKKGHTQTGQRKGNDSGGNPPKKSANELTKKSVVLDTKDEWYTSCNNGQGAW